MDRRCDGEIDLETAARVLGVHYQTAYRWVRTGRLPAAKVGGGYRVASRDVEKLAARRGARQSLGYTGRSRDWDRLRLQLHTALVAGDDTAARRVFEAVDLARVPMLEQCEELLTPTLRRLGEECAAGSLSGARVRVAAGICERSLEWAVSRLDPPAASCGVALVVTPKGEEHRLPAFMAGAVLRSDGWTVREILMVGPSEISDLADRIRPAMAVVSVTQPDTAGNAELVRIALEGTFGVPVLVGGPGQSLRRLLFMEIAEQDSALRQDVSAS
jgi:excisionase family DNA binding protein